MVRGALRVLVLVGWLGSGCGSSGGGGDVPFVPDDVPADAPAGDPGPDAAKPFTEVTEPFRAAFPYKQYAPSSTIDMAWVDPALPQPDPGVSFTALLQAMDPTLSCDLGCFVAPSGRWLAVVISGPTVDMDGSVVRLYRLSGAPALVPSGIADVVGTRAFAFGTDSFVFTRPVPSCVPDQIEKKSCVKFFRIDLAVANPAGEEFLFTFPTADQLDKALPHSGRFTMGEDGRTIVVLGPTVGSQSAWLWRGPTGLPFLVAGPICGGKAPGGGCLESGSAFTDADPVALSPDGNHLVMALVENDRALVLTHADVRQWVEGEETPRTSVSLLAMPEDISYSHEKQYCYNPPNSWQPTFVLSPLRFSPDGTEIVFVAGRDCAPDNVKPWSDVLALPLTRLLEGGALARGDLRWITDFPHGNVAANVSIPIDSTNPNASSGAMDLSPSGDYVVFVGTPRWDSAGDPIGDAQDQHRDDHEVWVTRRDGTTQPTQLTARQGWKATSVRAIPVPPIP